MKIKMLCKDDNLQEYLDLISQLKPTNLKIKDIVNFLENRPEKIFVAIVNEKIVGSITFILEQKIIHDGKFVLHIEDVIVDKNFRGNGYASKLLNFSKEYAKKNKCYKIILDCDKKLNGFYSKNGFENRNIQMSLYL